MFVGKSSGSSDQSVCQLVFVGNVVVVVTSSCERDCGSSDQLVCQIVYVGKVVIVVTNWCVRLCMLGK